MGFMEGFADAFGRQMELGAQRRHETRRDAFQIAYDKYVKDRATYDAAKAEDTTRINAAKSITSSLSAYGVPEAAWEHAYQWLGAGYTPGQVEEKLKTTIFGTTATPAMSDTAPAPQSSDNVAPPQSIDDQTAASGLAPGQEQTAGQQNPDLMGSIFGANGLLNPEANRNRIAQRAQDSVISQTGISREEFDRYGAGYQPYTPSGNAPSIEGVRPEEDTTVQDRIADWNANFVYGQLEDGTYVEVMPLGNGSYVNVNGQPVVGINRTMSQDFSRRYDDALKYVSEQTKPLAEQKASVLTLADRSASLVELVENNEAVLTVSSNLSTLITTVTNEVNAIMGQATELVGPEIEEAEKRAINAVTSSIVGTDELSNAKRQFESQRVQFIFSLARSMNGPGPLTAGDIEQAASVIGTTDKDEFVALVQNLVKAEGDKYNRLAEQSFKNDSRLRDAINMGVSGVEDAFGPIEWGENSDFMERELEAPTTTPRQGPNPNQLDTGIRDTDLSMELQDTHITTLSNAGVPAEILEKYRGKKVLLRRNDDGTFSVLDETGAVIYE